MYDCIYVILRVIFHSFYELLRNCKFCAVSCKFSCNIALKLTPNLQRINNRAMKEARYLVINCVEIRVAV